MIDVRAVFQQGHRDLAVDKMPPALLPRKGRFGLIDHEKVFCPDPNAGDIFALRDVNRETGCVVVVRPDQYVSHLLSLDDHEALADRFAGILVDAKQGRGSGADHDRLSDAERQERLRRAVARAPDYGMELLPPEEA